MDTDTCDPIMTAGRMSLTNYGPPLYVEMSLTSRTEMSDG